MTGPPALPEASLAGVGDPGRIPNAVEAGLDPVPEVRINGAQFGDIHDDPLGLGVGAGEPDVGSVR